MHEKSTEKKQQNSSFAKRIEGNDICRTFYNTSENMLHVTASTVAELDE